MHQIQIENQRLFYFQWSKSIAYLQQLVTTRSNIHKKCINEVWIYKLIYYSKRENRMWQTQILHNLVYTKGKNRKTFKIIVTSLYDICKTLKHCFCIWVHQLMKWMQRDLAITAYRYKFKGEIVQLMYK